MTQDPNTLVGQSLGRYQVDARLGAGGMGVVYRAHDKLLQRDVAIKLLGDGVIEPDRLLQEARNISALNHPIICTVYEVGGHMVWGATARILGDLLTRLGAVEPQRAALAQEGRIERVIQKGDDAAIADFVSVVETRLDKRNLVRTLPDPRAVPSKQ